MRRRFIAILALHFLVSLGLFGSGHARTSGSAEGTWQVAAAVVAADPAGAPQVGDVAGNAQAHGLADSQTELPEVLHMATPVIGVAHPITTPMAPRLSRRAQPTLDGPQRPPRFPIAA